MKSCFSSWVLHHGKEYEEQRCLGTYLWSAVYFKRLFWSFLPLNIWKLIMVLTHLIVSSELPVARNWPLLAAHLIQPACSFSAKIGFSLYCSTMNTKIIQLLFKKSSLCGILSMWKLPQALPLHRQRQIRPKLVHRSQLRLPSVVPPWWLRTRSQVTIGLTFKWEMEGKATTGKIGYGEGVHTKWLATTVDFEGRRMLV